MSRFLLTMAALVTVPNLRPVSSMYIETRYGDRNFFCRDRYGFVGDCDRWSFRPRQDYDYGYRTTRSGRKVGQGSYNILGDFDAEMVCDFRRDGHVQDPVMVSTSTIFSRGEARQGRIGRIITLGGYSAFWLL